MYRHQHELIDQLDKHYDLTMKKKETNQPSKAARTSFYQLQQDPVKPLRPSSYTCVS